MTEINPVHTRFDPRDPSRLRQVLGQFVTGITVITAIDASGKPIGFTANSFNSVSLDPPLVLWSLASSSERLAAYSAASGYAINVLGSDHADLAMNFASKRTDRFAGIDWRVGENGAPLLAGALARFECSHEDIRTAGDHTLFVGRVTACSAREGNPLCYFGGSFAAVTRGSEMPQEGLVEQLADISALVSAEPARLEKLPEQERAALASLLAKLV